jgi:hypothetical protein
MKHDTRRRLTLELDSASEPITGRMREGNGHSRPFAGWLGLAAALGSFLGRGEPTTEAEPAQTPTSTERARPSE